MSKKWGAFDKDWKLIRTFGSEDAASKYMDETKKVVLIKELSKHLLKRLGKI